MAQSKQWQGIPTNLSLQQFDEFVLPHVTRGSRGPHVKLTLHKIFNYILLQLYLGCQWKELPIEKRTDGQAEIHYTRIYRTFRRWMADGCIDAIFTGSVQALFKNNLLDTSVVHGDGTTTVAKKGGDNIGFSGHKHLKGDKVVCDQGFNPDYLIADQGMGLRAGQAIVWHDKPCHGDVFHILQQCESLANVLDSVAQGASTQCQALELKMEDAKENGTSHNFTRQLGMAKHARVQTSLLANDVKTLTQWLRRDVLELAGPCLATRVELFDFVTAELAKREHLDTMRIRPVRVALRNQRDDLRAFAGVLDDKLESIAQTHTLPMAVVRQACVLQRKPNTSPAYWQGWCQLCSQMGGKCHAVFEAVMQAMAQTPRCSSMVENLNSRLRNYFTLRRQLGGEYLGLLQFFLNHRTFLRSRVAERVGKSPKQLMTGQAHPHWLTLLGFGQPQPLRT